jgi:hypothetical protein
MVVLVMVARDTVTYSVLPSPYSLANITLGGPGGNFGGGYGNGYGSNNNGYGGSRNGNGRGGY